MRRKSTLFALSATTATFLIAGCFLIPASPALAEEYKARVINSRTKLEMEKIPDQEGHIVGIYQRTGLMFHENGEVANEVSRGTFEMVKGVVSYKGYCLQTFKDGSTQWIKYEGSTRPDPDGKSRTSEAEWELTQGTGRFEGIKGSGTYTGTYPKYVEDTGGFAYFDFTGTYTVPDVAKRSE